MSAVPSRMPQGYGGKVIEEPSAWAPDGGVRREPVYDHNFKPPRLIRRVGWHKCITCTQPFWSEDVVKNRMCDLCRNKSY